jgi:hypothetical protein
VLYLVLGLVLAAFGLLITALATAHTLFAWVSVAVSVLAAGLLVFDWLRGRRRAADAAAEAEPDPVLLGHPDVPFGDGEQPFADTVRDALAEAAPIEPPRREPARRETRPEARREVPAEAARETSRDMFVAPERAEPERVEPERVEPEPVESAAVPADEPDDRPAEPPLTRRQQAKLAAEEPGEPGEEPTDATDLLVVSDLRFEVRVVDEHPRYHLSQCSYLLDKPTLPLPVAEARQLGFTPCARCGPDATLAARHRATAR